MKKGGRVRMRYKRIRERSVIEMLPHLNRTIMQKIFLDLHAYSQIVLYDRDGCSVGNIKSPLRKIYLRLKGLRIEKMKIYIF